MIIEYELVDANGNSIGSRVTTRDGLDHRASMDHVASAVREKRGNPNEILTWRQVNDKRTQAMNAMLEGTTILSTEPDAGAPAEITVVDLDEMINVNEEAARAMRAADALALLEAERIRINRHPHE
jgi:hypothetical protein